MEKFKLLEYIQQKPITKNSINVNICPFCNSKSLNDYGTSTTLVGFTGEDRNHIWNSKHCCSCNKDFTIESKGNNVWITIEKSIIIKGVPNCFEAYIYDCKCGGKITRNYTDLDGKPMYYLKGEYVNGKFIKHYKVFFKCNKCELNLESEKEYYSI